MITQSRLLEFESEGFLQGGGMVCVTGEELVERPARDEEERARGFFREYIEELVELVDVFQKFKKLRHACAAIFELIEDQSVLAEQFRSLRPTMRELVE